MNLIKATIATAAVITCCLGNEMPANAEASRKEAYMFRAGHNYGYAMGLVAGSCIHYGNGLISRTTLREMVEIASELNDTTPAIRKQIVKTVTDKSTGQYRGCLPTVRSVMGAGRTAPTSRSPYRSADNWN